MCEPKHGVFSKLHRLTREAIEGAPQALDQMRKYGYEVVDAGPVSSGQRRGSVGSAGSRRGSMSVTGGDDYRSGSISPYRATTPEARRETLNRYSPDSSYSSSNGSGGRRGSHLAPPAETRRSSMGTSPLMRRTTPGKSPLASPRNSRYVKLSEAEGRSEACESSFLFQFKLFLAFSLTQLAQSLI